MVDRPVEANLDAVALRLFGWLMLFGAGLLLLVLAAVLRLPVGPAGYLIPGTDGHHAIGVAVVPVLALVGGVLALLGLGAFLLVARTGAGAVRILPVPGGRGRRPLVILAGGLTLLAIALLHS